MDTNNNTRLDCVEKNEMKILIERSLIVEIATMLDQMIRKNPHNRDELQRRLDKIDTAFAKHRLQTKMIAEREELHKIKEHLSNLYFFSEHPEKDLTIAMELLEEIFRKNPVRKDTSPLISVAELAQIVKIGQEIYGEKNTEEKEEPVCLVTKDENGKVTITGSGVTPKAAWTEPPPTEVEQQILKDLRKQIDAMKINPCTANPDPRCDGCEYQHPYLDNMRLGELSNNVYCNRGSHPPYYKNGKTIKYDPSLMICHRYEYNSALKPKKETLEKEITEQTANYSMFNSKKHDDSQIPVRSKEANIQAIKDAIAKDQGKLFISEIPNYNDFIELKKRLDYCEDAISNDIEDKWARCHNTIIEILNILASVEEDKARFKGISAGYESELHFKINKLKAKLVGEE